MRFSLINSQGEGRAIDAHRVVRQRYMRVSPNSQRSHSLKRYSYPNGEASYPEHPTGAASLLERKSAKWALHNINSFSWHQSCQEDTAKDNFPKLLEVMENATLTYINFALGHYSRFFPAARNLCRVTKVVWHIWFFEGTDEGFHTVECCSNQVSVKAHRTAS